MPHLFKHLKAYFDWHSAKLARLVEILILLLDGSAFCRLFNMYSALRQRSVRFRFDPQAAQYTTTDETGLRLRFFHKKQAVYAYSRGLVHRATSIGSDYFLNLVDFAPGDLVVDCGANIGDIKLYFRLRNIDIEYLAIEPSPKEFMCLKDNVAPSHALNIGLWDADGHLDFYVSSQTADSSLIAPPTYDEVIKVPTQRLDHVLDRRIKLLKVEAEGAEPEVLSGCSGLLDQIEYIAADLGFERGVEQTSTLAPVINLLLARNFELVEVSHHRVVALFRNKSVVERPA